MEREYTLMTDAKKEDVDWTMRRLGYALTVDTQDIIGMVREYSRDGGKRRMLVGEPLPFEIEIYKELFEKDEKFVSEPRIVIHNDPLAVFGDRSNLYDIGSLQRLDLQARADIKIIYRLLKSAMFKSHAHAFCREGERIGNIILPERKWTI